MSNILKIAGAGVSAAAEETDPNFNQTVLLLHGDGTNGAQNNTFLDSSTNNFTITRNGNTTQGTFSPFSAPDGRWSNYFPSSTITVNQKISGTLSSGLGTGDFSFEFFVWWIASPTGADGIFYDGGANGVQIIINASGQITVGYRNGAGSYAGSFITASAATAVTKNAWTHVQLIRSGTGTNETVLYINGVSAATATVSYDFTSTIANIGGRFAVDGSNWYPFQGYLANYRISNTNRTAGVPTSPLTSDANTLLLTCQSNRFADSSSNTIAITKNGSTSITPFSPFAPTAAYSASVNGGSGYFDAVDDFLTAGSAANWNFLHNGNAWTIQFFMYMLSTSSQYGLVSTELGSGDYGITLIANANTGASTEAGTLLFRVSKGTAGTYEVNFDIENFFVANQWSYISVSFDGVDTYNFYRDGVLIDTHVNATPSYAANTATNTLHIGAAVAGGTVSRDFSGYLSSLKISDVVVSGLTSIPTAPFTSDANTELLCNFTNAGIFDQTGKNNLETVGNAQIDTTTKKYGTGSMEFDGTGDYLQFLADPNAENFNLGTGDFTVEFWYYEPIGASAGCMIDTRRAATSGLGVRIRSVTTGSKIEFEAGPTINSNNNAHVQGVWQHVAGVRYAGTMYLYINGVQQTATAANTTNLTDSTCRIGIYVNGLQPFTGYIDDLRITKGVARYTSAFTPPTAPFLDQ
jgi:hypothetical protein